MYGDIGKILTALDNVLHVIRALTKSKFQRILLTVQYGYKEAVYKR